MELRDSLGTFFTLSLLLNLLISIHDTLSVQTPAFEEKQTPQILHRTCLHNSWTSEYTVGGAPKFTLYCSFTVNSAERQTLPSIYISHKDWDFLKPWGYLSEICLMYQHHSIALLWPLNSSSHLHPLNSCTCVTKNKQAISTGWKV